MKKLFALLVFLAFSAFSQTSFDVATGDLKAGSTYAKMFSEFASICPVANGHPLVQVNSTGSVANIEKIVDNKVNGAWVQSDMLFLARMENPSDVVNVRTLVTLHPEELHFIARGDVKKEGGFLGIGGTEVKFNTIEDLSKRTVGAVGGSVKTGRIVSAQSGLNYVIREFPNNEALSAALLKGDIDTILVVAGQPSSFVNSLDSRFKLLPITPKVRSALAEVYTPTKIAYKNLTTMPIDTVSVQALFVVRKYNSKDMIKTLADIRKCFVDSVGTLQDAKGTHAKWQLVDPDNKGKWQYYEGLN